MNKFGDRNDNYWQVAMELLKILQKNSDALGTGSRGLKGHWVVPFERKKDFVGRGSVVEQLIEKVHPHLDRDNCQRTAIVGLGGVGKTRLALEVAHRIHEKDSSCSIFWVSAVDTTSFEQAYRDIGRTLGIDGIKDDNADVKSLVKQALSYEGASRWILVVDNADDIELMFGKEKADSSVAGPSLARSLPFNCQGSILFTTRNYKAAVRLEAQERIDLGSMETSEAYKFLENNLDSRLIGDMEGTMRLTNLLANFPLAIKQASAYMNENKISAAKYIEMYEKDDDEMVYLLSQEFEDLGRYENTKNPIATTWVISFRQISRSNPLAADYLRFMCFLAEQDIPQALLPQDRDAKTAEAIGTLKAYSFINERGEAGSYDIHRLVQLSARCWLKERRELNVWAKKALRWLARAFPIPKHGNRVVWMPYLSHAQSILRFRKDTDDREAERELLFKVGESLRVLGKYQESENMQQQALELGWKMLGEEHPDTLASMDNLGLMFRDLGKYEEAEQMLRQSLELREKVLGKEHPDTLTSMNNFALVLPSLGKYKEAEQMHRRTLELREKVLGKEHPHTLNSMNNLAIELRSLGKYEESEQMLRQTLELREKVVGKEHPDTLNSMNNLAVVLRSLGKYEKAEQMH